jgi:hypothetical protein
MVSIKLNEIRSNIGSGLFKLLQINKAKIIKTIAVKVYGKTK